MPELPQAAALYSHINSAVSIKTHSTVSDCFSPQVRSIIGQIRPERQTLLFSATMPNKVERLVRDALTSPVRITVGETGAANEDITQVAFPGSR